MQTQQTYSAIASIIPKPTSNLIDPQKIKIILSKKLESKIPNPEQLVEELDKEISYQIEKTEFQIGKEKLRQDKIKLVESRELKARSLLNQKIQSKLQKSEKKKVTQDKNLLQKRINARKLKEEFVENRKQQIYQSEFKQRLERFKQIKAENAPNQQSSNQQSPRRQSGSLLKRSFSQRSSLVNPIQKSKQLEELQYYKKLQIVQKRKIYEKPEPKIQIPQFVDKKDWIEKINSHTENKFIQKLGEDLWKIEQARKKKEKEIDSRVQKMKKQAELRQQQRQYRREIVKQDINQLQKNRKQMINKKNERFLTMRNKSTPQLLRNMSSTSQNQDTFGVSINGKLFESTSKMSRTLQNFNQSKSIQRAKAQDYMVKEKQRKIKKEAIAVIEQVLREEKIELLMK